MMFTRAVFFLVQASAQVTAAVLMYRAVTYLPSISLGALACPLGGTHPLISTGLGEQ